MEKFGLWRIFFLNIWIWEKYVKKKKKLFALPFTKFSKMQYDLLSYIYFCWLYIFNSHSKRFFRYVLSTIRDSSGEDFEKNNFTKLGKITGLGRRNKISLERKFCNIYTIEDRRREDWRKSGAPLHHATNHVWDFGKSVSSRPRSRDW